MEFYDGVSRGKIFVELEKLIQNVNQDTERNKGVSWGLQMAKNTVMELPAEGMWHDPGDTRYPIPVGVMVNVEVTQCRLQTVGRAWWDGECWKKVGGIIPTEWVTGWMMLPQPRKEKQHD